VALKDKLEGVPTFQGGLPAWLQNWQPVTTLRREPNRQLPYQQKPCETKICQIISGFQTLQKNFPLNGCERSSARNTRMTSGNPNDDPFSAMNPYSAATVRADALREGELQLPDVQTRGMISQVPILGVLMILQGAMEFLVGIVIVGYAIFMPQFMQQMQNQAAKQGGPQPPALPAQAAAWITIGGSVLAVVILAIALLTIYSGFKVYRFKSRTLAIVSLFSGLVMIATCYCFPTSLALTIYGLIVMLNPSVKLGFDLQKNGYSAQNIQRAFAILPLGR